MKRKETNSYSLIAPREFPQEKKPRQEINPILPIISTTTFPKEAIARDSKNFNIYYPNIKSDDPIIFKAIQTNFAVLNKVYERFPQLKTNKQFILQVIEKSENLIGTLFQNYFRHFSNDKEVVLAVLKKQLRAFHKHTTLMKDIDFVKQILNITLPFDKDSCCEQIKQRENRDEDILKAIPQQLLKETFVLEMIKQKPQRLQYLIPKLSSNTDLLIKILKINPRLIHYFPSDVIKTSITDELISTIPYIVDIYGYYRESVPREDGFLDLRYSKPILLATYRYNSNNTEFNYYSLNDDTAKQKLVEWESRRYSSSSTFPLNQSLRQHMASMFHDCFIHGRTFSPLEKFFSENEILELLYDLKTTPFNNLEFPELIKHPQFNGKLLNSILTACKRDPLFILACAPLLGDPRFHKFSIENGLNLLAFLNSDGSISNDKKIMSEYILKDARNVQFLGKELAKDDFTLIKDIVVNNPGKYIASDFQKTPGKMQTLIGLTLFGTLKPRWEQKPLEDIHFNLKK